MVLGHKRWIDITACWINGKEACWKKMDWFKRQLWILIHSPARPHAFSLMSKTNAAGALPRGTLNLPHYQPDVWRSSKQTQIAAIIVKSTPGATVT